MKKIFFSFLVFLSQFAFARALTITTVSSLVFGTSPQGDPAKTIPPGTVENASNASFRVSYNNNTPYTITLPASITMTGPAGGINTIIVNSFTSFPATTGLTSGAGTQTLLVGATRAALNLAQTVGSYSGTFTITVVP